MKQFGFFRSSLPPSSLSPMGDCAGLASSVNSTVAMKIALGLAMALGASLPAQSATQAPIIGEIQSITLTNPGDHWSGGTIVVGGQNVIIPRNLLIDLPANRLTLQEIFAQAPATCVSGGESGLAKADTCNTKATGGMATIHANHTNAGNIIAGDVLIEKGLESITGVVTYINYDEGYFVLSGAPNDPATGVMVRLNDPEGRHTIQVGKGCAGGPNCSPDPRFTLDGDNYTNVFSTGYPLCIPSTVARNFTDVIGLGVTSARADSLGAGDVLCPATNRPANNDSTPVDDSRRFAPIKLGDSITAEGNFETIGGATFLSAHTTKVAVALSTKSDPTQPDYLFLDEVEVDAAPYFNQRARMLLIGYATLAPTDVDFWTIHYDRVTNAPHELPLASVQGCDIAGGAGTCGAQGLVGAGANIFRIRYDIDFVLAATGQAAKPRLSACAHLRASPRFASLNICPSAQADGTSNLREEMGILSPSSHEIQARTGHGLDRPGLFALDVRGNQAPCCQYLFPFGAGLGGIAFQEFNEIDLNAMQTAFPFTALPWNLDRRLSPGGCIDTNNDGTPDCEATAQPLDPFPFEGYEPRNQVPNGPTGSYNDPNFTASVLTDASRRVYSFVDAAKNNFDGNNTLLAWPPVDPPLQPITPTVIASPTPGQNGGPDADADGVPDSQDNCVNEPNGPLLPDLGLHIQRDTNSDGFGNVCDPDLNNDGLVNAADTSLFLADFRKTGNLNSDFNGDHVVNNLDSGILNRFLSAGVPGPSGLVP